MNIHNNEAHYIFINENAKKSYNTIIDNINVWILIFHYFAVLWIMIFIIKRKLFELL